MSSPLPGLHLQSPGTPGLTLLDAMAVAAEKAYSAGGVFAFATERGVRAVLGPGGPLAAVEHVELVVGLDAITDLRALDALAELTEDRPGVRARALVNPEDRLFHPKLSWFRGPARTTLLVGSGNLTPGGLVGNHEAFVARVLTGSHATMTVTRILAWLKGLDLRALDDPEVRKVAQDNSGAERSLRRKMRREDEEPESEAEAAESVLIFEVSKNTEDGRTQLDVGKAAWRDYFGGVEGAQKQILVRYAGADELEPPRRLGNTTSTNFRFEAGARRDMAHPPADTRPRPIGVFRRMADGTYRYVLVWPGEAGHDELTAYLDSLEFPPRRPMRRPIASVAVLRAAWPGCPLL